jgi:hypothetical protein
MFTLINKIKKNNLALSELKTYLSNDKPIKSKVINEDLILRKLNFIKEITDLNFSFENCLFENIDFSFRTFSNRIIFTNCIIKDFFAMSIFYPKGFEMKNCIILGNFDLSCGGHNKLNNFIIENCIFQGEVDFTDCWFMGKVSIKNNIFTNGTNILGKNVSQTKVQFDDEYIILNNLGNVKIDH